MGLCFSPLVISAEITLPQFLEKVREQNLNLKLETAKQNAAEDNAVGIRLPPPMASYLKGKNDTGDSSTGFEIKQEIPFPTKMKANRESRIYESRAQKEMLFASQNEILAKAKFSYLELALIQAKISVINQQKEIKVEHIKLARSAVRSDSFLKIYTLKGESDLDLLENDLDSSKQKFREKQLALAELINEDQKNFNPIPIMPAISSIPEIANQENIPQLESLRFNVEAKKERQSEAKTSWLPDFNVSYKQMSASSMLSRNSEVMVGITLPFIYFWQPKAEASVANAETLQAQLNLNREKRSVEIKIATLYSNLESLQKQLLNLKNRLIPRAEQRVRIIRTLAARDMETIENRRETMEVLPELKMLEIDLRMQYEESISELEMFISNKGQSHE